MISKSHLLCKGTQVTTLRGLFGKSFIIASAGENISEMAYYTDFSFEDANPPIIMRSRDPVASEGLVIPDGWGQEQATRHLYCPLIALVWPIACRPSMLIQLWLWPISLKSSKLGAISSSCHPLRKRFVFAGDRCWTRPCRSFDIDLWDRLEGRFDPSSPSFWQSPEDFVQCLLPWRKNCLNFTNP